MGQKGTRADSDIGYTADRTRGRRVCGTDVDAYLLVYYIKGKGALPVSAPCWEHR